MFRTSLQVKFLENGEDAEVTSPLIYKHPELGEIIVEPGFITDFASVPGFILLPGIVPKVGKVRDASVIHDWIYRGHEGDRFTRAQADRIFLDAAIERGMSKWRAYTAYLGVRMGGWAPWNKNRPS